MLPPLVKAPILVASRFRKLPDAILSLLDRRTVVVPTATRAVGVPRPHRRSADH
jgi:hypothetical protein